VKTPVLIIEDGFEYTDRAHQWLGDEFEFTRAGNGAEALALLQETAFSLVYLDMNFNRIPTTDLLGPWSEIVDRFGGDADQARGFLEAHQGVYILAAMRDSGCGLPVLISYDFSAEPKRWQHLKSRYGLLQYLSDNAGPDQVRCALADLLLGGPGSL
jgi:hypothetical protein